MTAAQRIQRLEERMTVLERKLDENTETTKQVRDILASFHITGRIAKWITVVTAACITLYHGFLALFHK